MATLLSTPDQLALNLVWVLSVQNTSETADLPTQTSPVFIENRTVGKRENIQQSTVLKLVHTSVDGVMV